MSLDGNDLRLYVFQLHIIPNGIFFRKYRDELRFDLYWLINNLMFVSVQQKYSNFNSYLKVSIFKNGFIMITYTLNNGLFQFLIELYIQYFDFVNVQI